MELRGSGTQPRPERASETETESGVETTGQQSSEDPSQSRGPEAGRESGEPAEPAAPESPVEPSLSMEFRATPEGSHAGQEKSTPDSDVWRLLTGIPGLLTPVHISVSGEESETQSPRSGETDDGQGELWRRVRTRMSSPPVLAGLPISSTRPPTPNLQLRWITVIMALAMIVPAVSIFAWPSGSATQWPGVEEAFLTIDSLPANANVLVYWAYDPATAGELDLAAQPVTLHLLQRRARLSVVSLLPGGPATARQLINRARMEWQRSENLTVTSRSTWNIPIAYLSGGPSILALIGNDPDYARRTIIPDTVQGESAAFADTPDLSVIFAAQADDVQHWLEQVQPLNNAPVVAVVAAGADPVSRPYWESGQLVGLVSGFDGAYSYRRLLDEQDRRDSASVLNMQLVLQDWGHFVFFLVIILGNFAAVVRRGGGA